MSTEPDRRTPSEVGLEAMGHLREANLMLAAAYRSATDDVAANHMRGEHRRRNNTHLSAIAQAWTEAEVEFRRACMTLAPTIDASYRLADVESISERFADVPNWGEHNPVSIPEVATFDQHIHELFEQLQRQWPELEQQPPLAKFDDDDNALQSSWRVTFERHPLRVVFSLAILIYVIGSIFWMLVT